MQAINAEFVENPCTISLDQRGLLPGIRYRLKSVPGNRVWRQAAGFWSKYYVGLLYCRYAGGNRTPTEGWCDTGDIVGIDALFTAIRRLPVRGVT